MKKCVLALALTVTLSACASKPEPTYVFNPVQIEEQMKLSAKIVAESKQIRARSENAIRMASMTEAEKRRYRESVSDIPPGLHIQLPMNEYREAEQILDTIARYTDWDFEVRGKRPVNGAMVQISTLGATAFDLIIDVESQISDRAKVILIKNQPGASKHGVMVLEFFPTNI